MTPPRRMPADTQIATRVRGGNVCGLESVEADEGLVSNDYGQGKPNPFSKRGEKKETHGWVAGGHCREPKVGDGGRYVHDGGAIINANWCHSCASHCRCCLGLLLGLGRGLAGEDEGVIELIGHRRARARARMKSRRGSSTDEREREAVRDRCPSGARRGWD